MGAGASAVRARERYAIEQELQPIFDASVPSPLLDAVDAEVGAVLGLAAINGTGGGGADGDAGMAAVTCDRSIKNYGPCTGRVTMAQMGSKK